MSGKNNDNSHYVNNAEFLESLKRYHEKCKNIAEDKPIPELDEHVAECIMLICTNLSHRPNFINYPYKEDMVAEAILDCLKAVGNFNPEIGTNPFAYFTQIAWFAFLRKIKKEKKQDIAKFALIKQANGTGLYTKWLKDNGHLDPHATEDDIQKYHHLTDDDVKEIDEATKKKTKKKRKKKKVVLKKKPLFDDGDEE